MTNYTDNRLFAYGCFDDITDMLEYCDNLNFKKILPVPSNLVAMEDYNCIPSMNWRIQNWGTKWEALNVSVENVEDGILFKFETVGASLQMTRFLSMVFPTLWFVHIWENDASDMSGMYQAQNGRVEMNAVDDFGVFRCFPNWRERYIKEDPE